MRMRLISPGNRGVYLCIIISLGHALSCCKQSRDVVHQRPQPADDREFFFFFCPTFCYRIRSGGARAHARAATYGYALWSSERFVAPNCGTPYPSCARYQVGSPHTPTINMCTAGEHILRSFRASYDWSVRPVRGYMRNVPFGFLIPGAG